MKRASWSASIIPLHFQEEEEGRLKMLTTLVPSVAGCWHRGRRQGGNLGILGGEGRIREGKRGRRVREGNSRVWAGAWTEDQSSLLLRKGFFLGLTSGFLSFNHPHWQQHFTYHHSINPTKIYLSSVETSLIFIQSTWIQEAKSLGRETDSEIYIWMIISVQSSRS